MNTKLNYQNFLKFLFYNGKQSFLFLEVIRDIKNTTKLQSHIPFPFGKEICDCSLSGKKLVFCWMTFIE